jgi:hypothetical protein
MGRALTRAAMPGVTRRATQAKLLPLLRRVCNLLLAGQGIVGVGVDDGGQSVRGSGLVFDLGGHGVDGVDLHGHGQLVQVAVVEHAAAGSYLKGALLLLLRALNKFLVAHDLEPEEAAGDGHAQRRKNRQISQKRARLRGGTRGGFEPLRMYRRFACMADELQLLASSF